jgi:type II secretory pathway pseudopilin PulG
VRRSGWLVLLVLVVACAWLGLRFLRQENARQAVAQLNVVCAAIESYRADVSEYPPDRSDIVEVLRTTVPKTRTDGVDQGYLSENYSYPNTGGRALSYALSAGRGYELTLQSDGSMFSIVGQVPTVRCVTRPGVRGETHQARCECTVE